MASDHHNSPIKDLAGRSRQDLVEAGDDVTLWFEELAQREYLTISSDSDEIISRALLGKHLSEYVELERDGQTQIGKIDAISKTAGLVSVPPLGDVKEAVVLKWQKLPERVTQGQLLVTLKAGERLIDIHAPITGFFGGITSSAYEGATTRAGNRLTRIAYARRTVFVRYSLVKPSGLPECLRVDYADGYPLCASEWVCPDGPGIIGSKGRRWWLERNGSIPPTPDMGLALAKSLPAPFQIDIDHDYLINGEGGAPPIKAFWYSSKLNGDEIFLPASSSVVLPNADREQFDNLVVKPVDPFELYPEFLCPPPGWWPTLQKKAEVLANPIDRNAVAPETKAIICQYLAISRQKILRNPSRPSSTKKAITNISMAYTLSERPLAQEICAFFSFAWPTKDLVFQDHRQELYNAITERLNADWLNQIVDSLIDEINSSTEEIRHKKALEVGIRNDGCMNSGLVLAADGYELGEAWIPCIDLSGLFNFLPGFAKTGRNEEVPPTPSFFDALHSMIREAINSVRMKLGLPRIGEGWITETYLYNRIKELLPNETVLHHGRPRWLGRQHFDIWLPDRNIAVEYQGEQHFIEISLFGGRDGLVKTQQRDAKKRRLCEENGVTLIEINFNDDLRDEWIKSRLLAKF